MIRIISVIVVVVLSFSVMGQDFQLKHYGNEGECPQTVVAGIAEDSLGFMYIGFSEKGVYRFDGYNFFRLKNHPSHLSIVEIYKTIHHQILVSTADGVYYVEGDSLKKYEPLKNTYIRGFFQYENGKMYVGSEFGDFMELQDHKVLNQFQEKNNRIGQVAGDKAGNVYFIGGKNTVNRYREGNIQSYSFSGNKKVRDVWSVCVSSNDALLASSLHDIQILEQGKFREWEYKNKLLKPFANYIYKDSRDRIWFLHLDGLSIFDNGKVKTIPSNNFKGLALITVYEDSKGNFWFGTTKGLMRLQNENCLLNPITLKAEFLLKNIFEDSRGRIWTGTELDGVVMLDTNNVQKQMLPTDNFPSVFDFLEDEKGHIWIATDQGIFVVSNTEVKYLKRGVDIPNATIYSLTRQKNGSVWASYRKGVLELQGSKVKDNHPIQYLYEVGDDQQGIIHLFTDSENVVWAISKFGISRKVNQRFEPYVIDNTHFKHQYWGIEETKYGNIWLATQDTGLIKINTRLKNAKFYNSEESTAIHSVVSMTKDGAGNLLLGTRNGVVKVLLDGADNITSMVRYYKESGLIDDECEFKMMLCDRNNDIWFGSGMGLIKFTEPQGKNIRKKLPTYIYLNGEPVFNNSAERIISWQQRDFSINFLALHYSNPSAIEYSYRLKGADKDWMPFSSARNISYSGLKPGNYLFEVRTKIAGSNEWHGAQELSIKIQTPFWRSIGFKALVFVVALVVAVLALRYWTKRIRIKQARKEEQKRRQIESELKFLRNQMNPHFLFNSINSIQNLILTEQVDKSLIYLNDFGKLIRRVLKYSEKESVTLGEEIEFLKEYINLEKLRFKEKVQIEFSVDPKLDTEFDRIPPMLIQPFVENAIKHGLLPKKQKGSITICFKQNAEMLYCSIEDNGVGRAHAVAKAPEYESKGTSLVKERIEMLTQKFSMEKDFDVVIVDLKDAEGMACGTRVELTLPLF